MPIRTGVFVRRRATSGGTITLTTITIGDSEVSPDNALCDFTLGTTGGITYTGEDLTLAPSTWGTGVAGADYEARMTTISGTLSAGSAATATWLVLSTARIWKRNRTSNVSGTDTYSGTLEIRDVATQTVQASVTATISATVI